MLYTRSSFRFTGVAFFLALILLLPDMASARSTSKRFAATFAKPFAKDNAAVKPSTTLEDLIETRIHKELDLHGKEITPELLNIEANYLRTSVSSPDMILYETSFHLDPRYFSTSAAGPDSMFHKTNLGNAQPIMYYVGDARTPLALPLVSNLSKALNGDEASYSVRLGILPLPRLSSQIGDSVRYYVVIERAIESNHSEGEVELERFAKEFIVRQGEAIPLKLENAPPEKNAYIVRFENGSILHFYEDFARFFDEHILLSSSRLHFALGKETMSAISSRLSFPYSVAQSAHIKCELISVVDTSRPLLLVDTIRPPADYLAEVDMKNYADGPYRYRYTARELGSNKILFSETHDFRKASPVMVSVLPQAVPSDTLIVGGKKVDYASYIKSLNFDLNRKIVQVDRLDKSLTDANREKKTLEEILNTKKSSSIAGIRARGGFGLGSSGGTQAFVGIESSAPSLALDVSFGFLYANAPFLNYTPPANFSQIASSPKSLGFQVSYEPIHLLHGLIEPLIGVGYYGIWANQNGPGSVHSATLISIPIGLASEPMGEGTGLGLSLTLGPTFGLGLSQGSLLDVTAKAYVRF